MSRVAIEHFELYGTQWQKELGERTIGEQLHQNLPPIDGADQPVGTRMEVLISPDSDELALSERDTGWLAQFYIRPNPFFFVDPAASGLVGPLGLKLASPREITGVAKRTYLYPDPEGTLAMVMVIGGPGSGVAQDAFAAAYDIVGPLLDEIAFEYHQPLPIAHAILIGVPSGTITTAFPKPPKIQTIDVGSTLRPRCPLPELEDATALYREGISSNNPFHQFLALWKAYENVDQIRRDWRERTHWQAV